MCSSVLQQKTCLWDFLQHGNRYQGEKIWKTSSVCMVHPPTSALITPRRNNTKALYRSCANTKSSQVLPIHIIIIITLPKAVSRSIRITQTPSVTGPVILDTCRCMSYWFGLVYIIVWAKFTLGLLFSLIFLWYHPQHIYYDTNKALPTTKKKIGFCIFPMHNCGYGVT